MKADALAKAEFCPNRLGYIYLYSRIRLHVPRYHVPRVLGQHDGHVFDDGNVQVKVSADLLEGYTP
jgi:glutamyl/glutaminyl-tRNA synthetase